MDGKKLLSGLHLCDFRTQIRKLQVRYRGVLIDTE